MDFFEGHVFISDVHLGAFHPAQNKEIEAQLISLIHYCANHKYALYVLGDLFDYWMEYPAKNFIPGFADNVLDAFEAYNKGLAPALYITGNHDNWTFGHFHERGFDVEENYREIHIAGYNLLLMHGDGVAGGDIHFPRKRLHRILRNPLFVKAYQKILPPRQGLALMKWFSAQTRKRDVSNPKPLNDFARDTFKAKNLDYIICGHDHLPRQEHFGKNVFINTGAFFKHQSVAVYTNGECTLVKWQANSQNFVPFSLENKHYT